MTHFISYFLKNTITQQRRGENGDLIHIGADEIYIWGLNSKVQWVWTSDEGATEMLTTHGSTANDVTTTDPECGEFGGRVAYGP